MATILSHPAIPLALGLGCSRKVVSPRLLAAGILSSILPDLDFIAFPLGFPYHHMLGHRGLTHSLVFALMMGLVGLASHGHLGSSRAMAFAFVFVSTASHGVIDAFTNGGLGVAFFAPFSHERYFFPWQVILVAPLRIAPFFTSWGWAVMKSEIHWIWLPSLLLWALVHHAAVAWGRARPSHTFP